MNGSTQLATGQTSALPGGPTDPAIWFVKWVRESIQAGAVDPILWTQNVMAIRKWACMVDMPTYNTSVGLIRDYLTGAQIQIPSDFPTTVDQAGFAQLRSLMSCALPTTAQPTMPIAATVQPMTSKTKKMLALGGFGVAVLVGGILYLTVRGKKPKRRKAFRRTKRRKSIR